MSIDEDVFYRRIHRRMTDPNPNVRGLGPKNANKRSSGGDRRQSSALPEEEREGEVNCPCV